jgi:hypothetical protein
VWVASANFTNSRVGAPEASGGPGRVSRTWIYIELVFTITYGAPGSIHSCGYPPRNFQQLSGHFPRSWGSTCTNRWRTTHMDTSIFQVIQLLSFLARLLFPESTQNGFPESIILCSVDDFAGGTGIATTMRGGLASKLQDAYTFVIQRHHHQYLSKGSVSSRSFLQCWCDAFRGVVAMELAELQPGR